MCLYSPLKYNMAMSRDDAPFDPVDHEDIFGGGEFLRPLCALGRGRAHLRVALEVAGALHAEDEVDSAARLPTGGASG